MNVYLAGKVGGNKWAIVKDIKGVKFIASDGSNHSEHEWGLPCGFDYIEYLREGTKQYFIKEIRYCSYLIAYLDTPDSYGSIAEIAYMSCLGKSCHVILLNSEHGYLCDIQEINPMYDAYWFVSSLPYVKIYLAKNIKDAAQITKRICNEYFLRENTKIIESPLEKSFYQEIINHIDMNLIYPQYNIGSYRVDFAVPDHHLVIELDGHDWHKTKEQRTNDAKRQRFLTSEGWVVVRFTGSEIYKNLPQCINEVVNQIKDLE